MDMPRAPAPRYSLKYLHWLADKAKRKAENELSHEDAMDVDNANGADVDGRKKQKLDSSGTTTERVMRVLQAME